ncbi:MAG TPA: hypothetical protein VH418_21035 [Solirubrobacteraceae bacterium]
MGGGYESWFLSARDPAAPRALWIRHTRWRPAEGRESVALWCTLFDPEPVAVKQSLDAFPPDARADADGFRGAARAGGHAAEWELAPAGGEPPLRPLRPAALYRAPVPRTKLEAPLPDGIVSGRLTFDSRRVEVAGWRATVGHNWGSEHAERWVWLHAAELEEAPDAWLELVVARVRLGRVVTPWLGGGALSLAGERLPLGGPGRRAAVSAAPGRLQARVSGPRTRVRVAVEAPLAHTVAFAYANPSGGDGREALHAGACAVRLRVERRGRPALELASATGAAYELGVRGGGHGVPLQPFPDP